MRTVFCLWSTFCHHPFLKNKLCGAMRRTFSFSIGAVSILALSAVPPVSSGKILAVILRIPLPVHLFPPSDDG